MNNTIEAVIERKMKESYYSGYLHALDKHGNHKDIADRCAAKLKKINDIISMWQNDRGVSDSEAFKLVREVMNLE